MLKKIALILLTFSFFFVIRESLNTLHSSHDFRLPQEKIKEIPGGSSVQKVDFYPNAPDPLPELTENYIFNSERHLAEDTGEGADNREEKIEEQQPQIDMEDLVYSGSIIIGENRKALVSYREIMVVQQKSPFPGMRRKIQDAGERKHALLGVFDKLGDYWVSTVEADKIVFQKDGNSIVKMLYQKNIKRDKWPAQMEESEKQLKSNPKESQKLEREKKKAVIFSNKPGNHGSEKTEEESQKRIPFR